MKEFCLTLDCCTSWPGLYHSLLKIEKETKIFTWLLTWSKLNTVLDACSFAPPTHLFPFSHVVAVEQHDPVWSLHNVPQLKLCEIWRAHVLTTLRPDVGATISIWFLSLVLLKRMHLLRNMLPLSSSSHSLSQPSFRALMKHFLFLGGGNGSVKQLVEDLVIERNALLGDKAKCFVPCH